MPSATDSDLQGVHARGAAMREGGATFWDNPLFRADPAEHGGLEDWAAMGLAWGAGWLEADAGRTADVQRAITGMSLR